MEATSSKLNKPLRSLEQAQIDIMATAVIADYMEIYTKIPCITEMLPSLDDDSLADTIWEHLTNDGCGYSATKFYQVRNKIAQRFTIDG